MEITSHEPLPAPKAKTMNTRDPRPLINYVGLLVDLWIRYPNGRMNVIGRLRRVPSPDSPAGCFLTVGESYIHSGAMVRPDCDGQSLIWECEEIAVKPVELTTEWQKDFPLKEIDEVDKSTRNESLLDRAKSGEFDDAGNEYPTL